MASRPRPVVALCAAGALATIMLVVACGDDSRVLRPAGPDQTQSIVDPSTTTEPTVFSLLGPWPDAGDIDAAFTCTGDDASPPLRWAAIPAGTTQLVIIVTNPTEAGFVHWVLTGIDPIVTSLADGRAPDGTLELLNGFGKIGWSGPCPAVGSRVTLQFELLALGSELGITSNMPTAQAIGLARAGAIATATYTGSFQN